MSYEDTPQSDPGCCSLRHRQLAPVRFERELRWLTRAEAVVPPPRTAPLEALPETTDGVVPAFGG